MMRIRFRRFKERPCLTSIVFQEEIFGKYPDVRRRFDFYRRSTEDALRSIVEEGKRDGEFSPTVDVETFVLLFMGALRMTVINWRSSGFSFDLEGAIPPLMIELAKILER